MALQKAAHLAHARARARRSPARGAQPGGHQPVRHRPRLPRDGRPRAGVPLHARAAPAEAARPARHAPVRLIARPRPRLHALGADDAVRRALEWTVRRRAAPPLGVRHQGRARGAAALRAPAVGVRHHDARHRAARLAPPEGARAAAAPLRLPRRLQAGRAAQGSRAAAARGGGADGRRRAHQAVGAGACGARAARRHRERARRLDTARQLGAVAQLRARVPVAQAGGARGSARLADGQAPDA
mmetsp:Transcript_23826/g.69932  ORF Transcript_23826/g.69932 Transcript_23826/m.69932 type:complete len:243 (+) Transcript_23826:1863-2591(+)